MQHVITVFVEGQGEQVFLRNLLFILYNINTLSFKCMTLHAGLHEEAPYSYGDKNRSKLHFTIINIENDEKVLSEIHKNERNILKNNDAKIIGIRDMYSKKYRQMSLGMINPEINKKFIEQHHDTISTMSNPDKISFHFAIMEIESWWLSMFTVFEKIHPSLTIDYIYNIIGINLKDADIEKCVFHPFKKLKDIMESVGKTYDKKYGEVETITSQITIQDIDAGISNHRCASLKAFYTELRNLAPYCNKN